jgi:predicted kinase
MEVVIMVGVSGSGKSTYIKDKLKEHLVCSADSYFMDGDKYNFNPAKLGDAHRSCMKLFVESCVGRVEKIVVDNTNTSIDQLAPYYSVARAFNYSVKLVMLEAPAEVCVERNSHGVNKKTIDGMSFNLSRLKIPPYWDCVIVKEKTF